MSILTWPLDWLGQLGRRAKRGAPDPDPAPAEVAGITDTRFGGEDDPEAEWVTVYDAMALEEAHVVRGLLAAEGLPVFLRYDTLSVVYGMTAGFNVKIQVPRGLQDRALAVLSMQAGQPGAWDEDMDV